MESNEQQNGVSCDRQAAIFHDCDGGFARRVGGSLKQSGVVHWKDSLSSLNEPFPFLLHSLNWLERLSLRRVAN